MSNELDGPIYNGFEISVSPGFTEKLKENIQREITAILDQYELGTYFISGREVIRENIMVRGQIIDSSRYEIANNGYRPSS